MTLAGEPAIRPRLVLIAGLVAAAAAAAVFYLSLAYFRSAEVQLVQSRLSLYQRTLENALERYEYLPYILARDAIVVAAAADKRTTRANLRLAEFAARAGLEAVYLMDTEGLTIAASNYADPQTFIGQNYGFRPYFKEALAGRRGEFFGIGATTLRPGFFVAERVEGAGGEILGVIAIKLDLTELQRAWKDGGETVLVSNRDGIVVLSARPEWLYSALAPLTAEQRATIGEGRQFGGREIVPLDWSQPAKNAVQVADSSYIHASQAVAKLGWRIHLLTDESRIYERAFFSLITFVILLAALLVAAMIVRSARMRTALALAQADRASLRAVNADLEREIEERRAAERRLEAAQKELARASKLAALGQLSASVTHELGQPISAMRNYLAAAEINGSDASGETVPRLNKLVDRMENITRQLRFFAEPGASALAPVALGEVLDGALELTQHELAHAGIDLTLEGANGAANGQAIVMGNRQRLEQVLVNLVNNARAAMRDAPQRRLAIAIERDAGAVRLSVADTGHGLGAKSIDELQEPFHTTRASGEGMGLGLSIAASIVREHGGQLSSAERASGGAIFTITLPAAPAAMGEHDVRGERNG
jgi:two-component system C4-dicarboxylate transport sensor histidine kinase DctB